MKTILRGADSTIRERLSGEIKLRLDRALQSGSASQLRAFINLFGFDDSSTTARLALAEKLIAADALLEAELHLGEVLESGEPNRAGAVRATLAVLYEKARRPELAARMYQELANVYAGVVCREGLTGKQLAERAAANTAVQAQLTHVWPHGQVEVKDADGNANFDRLATFQRQLAYPVQMTRYAGAAPRGLRVTYDLNQYLVSVRSDLGQTLATTSMRSTDGTDRAPLLSQSVLAVGPGPRPSGCDQLRGGNPGDRRAAVGTWRRAALAAGHDRARPKFAASHDLHAAADDEQPAARTATHQLRRHGPHEFQVRPAARRRLLLPAGPRAVLRRSAHGPVAVGARSGAAAGRDFWRRRADLRQPTRQASKR